jgi:magnesium transporter
MSVAAAKMSEAIFSLNQTYLRQHPAEAARTLESLPAAEAAAVLQEQPINIIAAVIEKLTPGVAESVLTLLPAAVVGTLFEILSIKTSVNILSRLRAEQRNKILDLAAVSVQAELKSLLDYPVESAGRLMNPRVAVFNESVTVAEALTQMKSSRLNSSRLYLVDETLQLMSQVKAYDLLFADHSVALVSLSKPVNYFVQDIDPRDEVMKKLEASKSESLPVLNVDFQVVGSIEGLGLIDVMRDDIAIDIQTMVGASREERALSSSAFAVRKRLPWLQINLLTAFLAAAVVSMFEATIAQFTALAVLMPIAAGQSGNTGAQALAVTMRGLTLREVSMRDWFKILRKEFAAGLINGIGVALVCGAGVYLWSSSFGLALVMALAMIISMTIAGVAGAVVPMLLKRFGLDPAQSSSIVLTTITDIAGFMSFLGIATILSGMLAASL